MVKRGVVLSVVLVVAVLAFVAYSFSSNLEPPKSLMTGNFVYSYTPLTIEDLTKGFSLDQSWNMITWTDVLDDEVLVTDAFASILSNVNYVYDYSQAKYWFNPNGAYATYINHSYYVTRQFDKVKPGQRYGIYMKASGILTYKFPPQPIKITMPDGSVVVPDPSELVCFRNNTMLNEADACGGSSGADAICNDSDGGINYSLKGETVSTENGAYTDHCAVITAEGNYNEAGVMNGTHLREFYCTDSGFVDNVKYELEDGSLSGFVPCPNGCFDGACINSVDNTPPSLWVNADFVSGQKTDLMVVAIDEDSYVDTIGYWYRSPSHSTWYKWGDLYYSCDKQKECNQSMALQPVDGLGNYSFWVRAYNKDMKSTSKYVDVTFY